MICIIDYGMGNLHSVFKAFRRLGAEVKVIDKPTDLTSFDRIVLPGVGDFKRGMNNLHSSGFLDLLNWQVNEKKIPILGICLGMQLLTNHSEEGDVDGLGYIEARTVHFKNLGLTSDLKIPHIGWNNIVISNPSGLLSGCNNEMVYFVHSYAVICKRQADVICKTEYGAIFDSGIQKENIYGLQFHPEKSHKVGLQILQNFINI